MQFHGDDKNGSGLGSSVRTPLLLHACCGPCSIEPVELLRREGFEPTICWTNPNIQPKEEHDRRLATLRAWAADVAHVNVIVAGDNRAAWEAGVAPHGFDRAARCCACYALRLAEACRAARELGFTYISTTLAVSPYQLFETCGDVLAKTAAAYGLTPVWRDFRPYYPEATRTSRDLGMYRQNYCGCRFSDAEAAAERVVNLVSGWNREIQEMMGGMGINAIDSLRGNRLMLRGVGLNEKELEILGVKYAGE